MAQSNTHREKNQLDTKKNANTQLALWAWYAILLQHPRQEVIHKPHIISHILRPFILKTINTDNKITVAGGGSALQEIIYLCVILKLFLSRKVVFFIPCTVKMSNGQNRSSSVAMTFCRFLSFICLLSVQTEKKIYTQQASSCKMRRVRLKSASRWCECF